MKRFSRIFLTVVVLFVLMTIGVSAYSLDFDRFSPFKTIIGNQQEHVNLSNGFLQITETDLVLPGKNGLDFRLVRKYESELADTQPLYDYSWRIYHPIAVGWQWDLPSLQAPVNDDSCLAYLGDGTEVCFQTVIDVRGRLVSARVNGAFNVF